MLGAWIEVRRSGGTNLWRRVSAGGSYASARDSRVLVGLGQQPDVTSASVLWPDGSREEFPIDEVDRYIVLRQGEGKALR